jgi:hypothetical protein
MTHHSILSARVLAYYKQNFVRLVREGPDSLSAFKRSESLA